MPMKDSLAGGRPETRRPDGTVSRFEARVDHTLEDSFPASDPPSYAAQRAGKDDKKAPLTEADIRRDAGDSVRRTKAGA